MIAAACLLLLSPEALVNPSASAAATSTSSRSGPPYKWFVRGLVGAGSVPQLPVDDESSNGTITFESGAHPLGRALATGFSTSLSVDSLGHWFVVVPGLFAQLDVTFLLLSGFWAYEPPSDFPFRIDFGMRLGAAISSSSRPSNDVPNGTSYTLIRPEVENFLDVAFPFPGSNQVRALARGALDTSVNLAVVFRWSATMGVEYAWGSGPL